MMQLPVFLQKIVRPVVIVLSALLAYQLALFTWALLPEESVQYSWTAPNEKSNTTQVSHQALLQLNIFGKKAKGQTQSHRNIDAPKTRLKVNLVGVVSSSDPLFSSAIISYKNQQASYFIGSKIQGANTEVSDILSDRVILNVNGAMQTLMLDQFSKSSAPIPQRRHASMRQGKSVSLDVDRQSLLKDPEKLTNYIRISPYRKNKELVGYRLKPGRDKSLFEEAGFKRNDLATELNVIDLTDTKKAFSLMKDFATMKEITVTVVRDGQIHELSLNIP